MMAQRGQMADGSPIIDKALASTQAPAPISPASTLQILSESSSKISTYPEGNMTLVEELLRELLASRTTVEEARAWLESVDAERVKNAAKRDHINCYCLDCRDAYNRRHEEVWQ